MVDGLYAFGESLHPLTGKSNGTDGEIGHGRWDGYKDSLLLAPSGYHLPLPKPTLHRYRAPLEPFPRCAFHMSRSSVLRAKETVLYEVV